MQTDFHFYTIYALARAAGFSPDNAHIVAYASQHTDDAKYEHALEFENGGRFQQVLTAHRFLEKDTFTKPTCYRIWVPFHFLPGNLGTDFYDRMTTRANSTVAQRITEDLLTSGVKPFALHRLGITMHVYADTWSHQGFIGVMNDKNDISNVDVKDENRGWLESSLGEIKESFVEYVFPKLGHAQAATLPDEPYREWSYRDYRNKVVDIVNQERALDAAQNCYIMMLRFQRKFPQFSPGKTLTWQDIVGTVRSLFDNEGDTGFREKKWQDAISSGAFSLKSEGRDKRVQYDDREWFRAAVKVTNEERDMYERDEGFETSDWKYFHDAGAYHRFVVLNEILPECGIICG